MSQTRPDPGEADVTRALRQASAGYDDLPDPVADRLDRVLDQLPAADTLHGAPVPGLFDRWAERLRPKRVRYALLSATAAVLVTVGAVAVAFQIVPAPTNDEGAASVEDLLAEDSPSERNETGADEQNEAAGPEAEGEEPGITDENVEVETFTTGSDYSGRTDLLAALRDLGTESGSGEVPAELEDLVAGGPFWQRCQEAIAAEYGSLLVAVDFARYEAEPAIMALLVSDSGELAVALSPACADGVIEQLAAQE